MCKGFRNQLILQVEQAMKMEGTDQHKINTTKLEHLLQTEILNIEEMAVTGPVTK